MDPQGRGWCFTLNNPDDLDVLLPQSWDPDSYDYLVYHLEMGAEGTAHLQGYLYFGSRIRFSQLKKWFPGSRVHLEAAKGTAVQNQRYCTKEEGRLEGPWEFGSLPDQSQGKRNDLLAVKADLDAGASLLEIADDHFSAFVRYHRSFKEYKLLKAPVANVAKKIIVVWGPTGTGKTRWAFDNYPSAFWKTKSGGSQQFWDGYDGESVIIVDEFYGWLPFDFMLRFLDRYPVKLEIKHGTVPLCADTIIFTSNKHPSEWYHIQRYKWDESNPLRRRLTSVRELRADGFGPDESSPGFSSSVAVVAPVFTTTTTTTTTSAGGLDDVPRFRNGYPAPTVTDLYKDL
ncbi:replication associated protein [Lake Sarah-associated circular virus-27]|uniref:replication associated protein n=1 Tax=Lake Sarah-associated circular virus-27 TaxID=1685754 RepID=UPI000777F981|nr:replication associated protein [Lake Sarah-associated circular virus-27]ALE29840.1 replication associated protein [Lake Sarah-associated circular virus-27]